MNVYIKKISSRDKFERTSTKRSIQESLDRFGEHILSVNVFYKDVNGPKGGIDKECRLRISLSNRKEIFALGKADTISRSTAMALEKACRQISNMRVPSRKNYRYARKMKWSLPEEHQHAS
jgi:hypothetical protein